jgi:hypoxanthine phosphoribosyltransferase
MKYLELSKKNIVDESRKLAKKIENDFVPEVVLFVAKGAFYMGKEIAEYFGIPFLEIFANRKKGIISLIKKKLSIILTIIPSSMKKKLRIMEIYSNVNSKNFSRNVYMESANESELLKYKKILLVDDSIDTGCTIIEVLNYLKPYNLEIKIASLNIFDFSKNKIRGTYYSFENTLLNCPWSKDSYYYSDFMEEYSNWKKK